MVFSLGVTKFQHKLPIKIQRILPGKLIRSVVIFKILDFYFIETSSHFQLIVTFSKELSEAENFLPLTESLTIYTCFGGFGGFIGMKWWF